ncbi:MAG TPA: hypothetical protein VK184_09520 [Nostocaceae cyanobacterium]|nr:hypothetical protein [Nostocaceae cyanobacterium]
MGVIRSLLKIERERSPTTGVLPSAMLGVSLREAVLTPSSVVGVVLSSFWENGKRAIAFLGE